MLPALFTHTKAAPDCPDLDRRSYGSLVQGAEYGCPAPRINKKTDFIGYRNFDFTNIRYQLSFTNPAADFGCLVPATGDTYTTNGGAPITVDTFDWDDDEAEYFQRIWGIFTDDGYHAAYRRVKVTAAGNFTFDSCSSEFVTSMGVYKMSDTTNTLELMANSTEVLPGRVGGLQKTMPWSGGCRLSGSARRTIFLLPGEYYVQIRGNILNNAAGGKYVLKLECHGDAAAIDPASANPGGARVDSITGQIWVRPENLVENTTMALQAIDTAGNVADIKRWNFDVVDPPDFKIRDTWDKAIDTAENTQPDYVSNQSYILAPPSATKQELFQNPAGEDSNEIVYIFLATTLNATCTAGIDDNFFGSSRTGRGVLKMTCNGQYTGRLIARDSAGAEVDVRRWDFEVSDDVPPDLSASMPEVEDNTNNRIVAISIISVLMISLAVVAVRWRQHTKNYRPADVDAMQMELLDGMGLSASKDIALHEFGITFTFLHLAAIDQGVKAVSRGFSDENSLRPSRQPAHRSSRSTSSRQTTAGSTMSRMVTMRAKTLTAAPNAEAWEDLQKSLIAAIKQNQPNLAHQLGKARVIRPAWPADEVLVVLPVDHSLRQHAVTEALQKAALSGDLDLGNNFTILKVALACPRRVPREIKRKYMQQLSGNTIAESPQYDIWKYQISEPHRGTPPYFAAAKMMKPNSDNVLVRRMLLKEAALMAVFDHRNVLGLVGVATVPADLPAMALLVWCENGTLKDHCANGAGTISTPRQLTFCAEICRGMAYISGLQIVHRDVMCANVLLDSTNTCKVSDFSMSATVEMHEKELLLEEPPVRWTAPEVLERELFSVASDVWSFGVTAWEVFSHGWMPFGELEGTEDVKNHILRGNRLSKPAECPIEVYEKLMWPCWEAPGKRPDFISLYHLAIRLGGQEDEQAVKDTREAAQSNSLRRNSTIDDLEGGRLDISAPSLHHLASRIMPETQKLVDKDPSATNVNASMEDMLRLWAKPASANALSNDGHRGDAYVNTLSGQNVGRATVALSYSSGSRLSNVVSALEQWSAHNGKDAKKCFIWIHSLCTNLHKVVPAFMEETQQQLELRVKTRIVSIGRFITMLDPWQKPEMLSNLWSMYELHTAIRERCDVEFVMSADQRQHFKKSLAKSGYGAVETMLENVKCDASTTAVQHDANVIRQLIEQTPGEYKAVDESVKTRLRAWFAEQLDGMALAAGDRTLRRVDDDEDGTEAGKANRGRRVSMGTALRTTGENAGYSNEMTNAMVFEKDTPGEDVPEDVLKIYFAHFALMIIHGVPHITRKDFATLSKDILRLSLADDDLDQVFENVLHADYTTPSLDVINFTQFKKAVQRGRFLKDVLVNTKALVDFQRPAGFDLTKATSENYRSPVPYEKGKADQFFGEYAEIRESMDYSHHTVYSKERQLWQDSVVDSVVVKVKKQTQPWIVYTCGPMGAGKGYALGWMSANGYFPLEGIVHIDPDGFKAVMPEWDDYVAASEKDGTIEPGTLTHQESGYMQEIAQEVAMRKSQNIWIDGSLRDGNWFTIVFKSLREQHPQYRIGIFYVAAAEKVIRERIERRRIKTGRGVPESQLVDSLNAPDKSLGMLVPLVDFVARINNDERVPRLWAFESVDRSGTWEAISKRFSHTQAAKEDFPHRLSPLFLQESIFPVEAFDMTGSVTKAIGDYSAGHACKVRIKVAVLKKHGFQGSTDILGEFSPAFPVTMNDEGRRLAQIPGTAFSFAFCYGIPEFQKRSSTAGDEIQQFLRSGGFVYFDTQKNLVGCNMVGESTAPNALHFGPCVELSAKQLANATRKHEAHFKPTYLSHVTSKGATKYACNTAHPLPFARVGFGCLCLAMCLRTPHSLP